MIKVFNLIRVHSYLSILICDELWDSLEQESYPPAFWSLVGAGRAGLWLPYSHLQSPHINISTSFQIRFHGKKISWFKKSSNDRLRIKTVNLVVKGCLWEVKLSDTVFFVTVLKLTIDHILKSFAAEKTLLLFVDKPVGKGSDVTSSHLFSSWHVHG